MSALLGHPEVILCHYDPLLPPLLGAADIAAAETRLKETPGQGYLRLSTALRPSSSPCAHGPQP